MADRVHVSNDSLAAATPRIAPRPWRWGALVLLGVVLLVLQVSVRARYDAARATHEARSQQVWAADRAAADYAERVHRRLSAARNNRDPSMADAAQALNGGSPFAEVVTAYGDVLPEYVDPATGGRAVLRRNGDAWAGVDPSHFAGRYGDDPRVGRGPDPNRGVHGAVMIGRRLAYMLGYLAWLVWFVAFLASPAQTPPARVAAALTLLEIAVASTFLASIGPRYLRVWDHFFQDDAPGWGLLVAIPVSLVLLARTARAARGAAAADGPPRCAACRYDLTGNQSGVCPECGRPTAEPAAV